MIPGFRGRTDLKKKDNLEEAEGRELTSMRRSVSKNFQRLATVNHAAEGSGVAILLRNLMTTRSLGRDYIGSGFEISSETRRLKWRRIRAPGVIQTERGSNSECSSYKASCFDCGLRD